MRKEKEEQCYAIMLIRGRQKGRVEKTLHLFSTMSDTVNH